MQSHELTASPMVRANLWHTPLRRNAKLNHRQLPPHWRYNSRRLGTNWAAEFGTGIAAY
jgi:hypothetical protein